MIPPVLIINRIRKFIIFSLNYHIQMNDFQIDFQDLVEGVNDYIYCTDAAGYFSYANPAILEALGFSLEDFCKLHFSEMIRPDFRMIAAQFYLDQIASGEEHSYFEFPTSDIHDESIWMGQNVHILKDAKGQVAGFKAIARDITKTRVGEIDMDSIATRLTSLIDNLDAAVLMENQYGQIIYANEGFCKLFNIRKSPEELIGFSYSNLVEKSSYLTVDAPSFIERVFELMNKRKVCKKERVELVDGRVFERSYFPIVNGDKYQGYFWKYNDVSARVQANLKQASLASIVENSIDAILSVDFEGNIVTWNDGAYKIFQYTKEEIEGQSLMKLFYSENAYRSKSLSKLIMAGKKISSFQQMGLRKNGHAVPLTVSVSPIKDNRERIIGFSLIASDISVGEKLKSQQDRLFELSLDLLCITDFKGNFKRVNPAFVKLLQYTEEDLLNKPFTDFLHPDDKELSAKEMIKLSNGDPMVGFENRYFCKDGSMKWFRWNANLDPETGDLYAVARDITDTKQVIAEVENYKHALDQSTILAITDPNGKITFVNDKFCEISKYSREEIIGKDHKIVNSGFHSDEFFKEMWDTIKRGEVWNGEIRNRAKDGSYYWVDTTITPFLNKGGEPIKYIATRYNITEKKADEDALIQAKITAEKSLKIKDEFIANMSHEIRTPMNAVIGFTDLLLESDLSDVQEDQLTTIKNSSELLLSMINDVLDLSKLESGRVILENVPFNLESVLNKVIKLVRFNAENKGLQLGLSIHSATPLNFIGDPTRLEQIFLNLLGNSIKFTEKGAVSITVKASNNTEDFAELIFHFSDTGIGIAEEKFDHIFKLFAKGFDESEKKYGGNGLGLAIVKGLTERLGGSVKLQSIQNIGTTFELTIPLKKDLGTKEELQKKRKNKADEIDKRDLGLKILLVEDNKVNQLLARTRLERWNCTVDIANNGREALEMINSQYQVVLMDIQMPEMDGYTATEAIRNTMPKDIATIPIIAMSAHASNGDAIRARKIGMNDYVFKPFKVDVLLEKLEKWGLPRKKYLEKHGKME